MPDQTYPVLLRVQAQLGLEWRQDVLPDRVPWARVVHADRFLQMCRLECLQILEGLRGDRLLGPARGQRSATRELLQRKPAAHPEVVVAGQTDRRMPAGQLHARVG